MNKKSPDPLDGTRARFLKDRARLVERHNGGEGGGVVVRAYRRLIDATVSMLGTRYFPGSEKIAVVAAGGYGRGELAFESDIDLHLVFTDPEPPAAVRPFLQTLWDLGWEIGHLVVSVEQAMELASRDRETLTSYLEMRTVWGDEGITAELERRIREEILRSRLKDYLTAKVEELERRHAHAGDTVYLSEPDVKQSPGGLRDLHTLVWLSNAAGGPKDWIHYLTDQHLSSEEYERLQLAYDIIWRVRNTLHLLKGRCWDRLDHSSQEEVADKLGYKQDGSRLPVEHFMRDYYRASWSVYAFTRIQLARDGWVPAMENPTLLTVLKPDGSEGETWPTDDFLSDPLIVLERFIQLAHTRSSLSPETTNFLYRNGRPLGTGARQHAGHGSLFMELLEEPNAAWSLHAMHQLGILGGLLPEFDRLTALVQYDPYHHYTADEHTLRMLDALGTLLDSNKEQSEGGVFGQINEVKHELPLERWRTAMKDAAILRLAILFHDIGKGTGGSGHAERGARLLRNVGKRLKLERAFLDDAVFLVRHHLILSSVAQRRDIGETVLLKRLHRLIRTPRRLHMLALLTVADMAALSPTTLTTWKCRLLVDLVDRLESLMVGEILEPPEDVWVHLAEQLPREVQDRVLSFLKSMPPQYHRDIDKSSLVADAALIESFRSQPSIPGVVTAAVEHHDETSLITMVTSDQDRLLSNVCGLLASHDVNILQARIFTRFDNLIFDRFTVSDAVSGGAMNREQVMAVLNDLPEVLGGRLDVEVLLEAHRDRWSLRDRPSMQYPVRVIHDSSASEKYTVIEVRAHDHVGLLHDVAATMAGLGVRIHQAFISTEGERAVDAFYVTDPLGACLDEETIELLLIELEDVLRTG